MVPLWIQVEQETEDYCEQLGIHLLWVQQVHELQQVQCHRRVPEERKSTLFNDNVVTALMILGVLNISIC